MLDRLSACSQPHRCGTILATSLILLLALHAVRARAADEAAGDTFAASLAADGAFADAGTAPPLSISGDGRYLAFVSSAANLSEEAPAGTAEVYVKDLETGTVELVSRADGEAGAPAEPEPIGGHPAGQIEGALISRDGRYVVFASPADNLVGGLPLPGEVAEERFVDHIYRRDLQTGETVLVDRVSGPAGAIVGNEARVAAISGDGRYVAIGSQTEDLEDPGGAHEEGAETLYVRDLREGTTTAVGRASDVGGAPGDLAAEGSFDGDITTNGRYVVFSSPSANLGPESNGLFQVYRRDLRTGETVLVSRTDPTPSAPEGELSDGEAFEPFFVGADGCRVAFTALEASNLFGAGGPPIVASYLRDLCASPPTTTLISLDEEGQPFAEGVFAGSAGDGREVLLKAADAGKPSHIYLRNLVDGATTLIDRASGSAGAVGDLPAERGAIAANGCRAVFSSGATNLTAEAPPASGSSQLLQAYARQLAPCGPPAEEPGAAPAGGAAIKGPQPLTLGVSLATRRRLWLDFDDAATARVRIQCRPGRHGWRLVKALSVSSRGPETVRLELAELPRQRCRAIVRLQVPGAEPTLHLLGPERPAPIR